MDLKWTGPLNCEHTAWLTAGAKVPPLTNWEAPGYCPLILRYSVKGLQDLDLGRMEAEPRKDKIFHLDQGQLS